MKRIIAFGALLAVCLVASYVTWTNPKVEEKAGSAEKIPMFTAAKDEVNRITWKSDDLLVDIERKKDDLGAYTWITTTETVEKKVPPPPPASDTDEPLPAPPPEKVTTVSKFRGNDQAEKLWEAFTPIKALRQLEGDDTLFGFDAPKATLILDRGGRPAEMKLGGETYGAKDRFVQYDGKAWLVDDADLRPLQFAKTRLMERGLQPLAEKDIASIRIQGADGGEAAWEHKNRQDQPNAKWTNVKAPDHEDAVGAGWIDKLLKAKIQSYPGVDSEPPATLKPEFTVIVAGDSDQWPITFLVGQTAEGKTEYWAKSAFDRSMVKLVPGTASEVLADARSAISSDGGTAPEPTPDPAPATQEEVKAP